MMKGWQYMKLLMEKMKLSGWLNDIPVPDFNVKIIFYEK